LFIISIEKILALVNVIPLFFRSSRGFSTWPQTKAVIAWDPCSPYTSYSPLLHVPDLDVHVKMFLLQYTSTQ